MNNTKRSINFAIAFMTIISFLTFIIPNINLEAFGDNLEIIFPNVLFFLFIIVFACVQFIFRFLITSKHYIKDKLFFSIDMKPSKLYSRMISYFAVITIFLWPVIASKDLSVITVGSILNLLIWVLVIEIMLYISYRYTKIYFMTDGILLRGLDFRIDIPLNDGLLNHSGFYPYYQIQNYTIYNNYLKLVLYNSSGIIEGCISDERIKPVAAFLESKEIRYIDKNKM